LYLTAKEVNGTIRNETATQLQAWGAKIHCRLQARFGAEIPKSASEGTAAGHPEQLTGNR
jgi:hypothetical protein